AQPLAGAREPGQLGHRSEGAARIGQRPSRRNRKGIVLVVTHRRSDTVGHAKRLTVQRHLLCIERLGEETPLAAKKKESIGVFNAGKETGVSKSTCVFSIQRDDKGAVGTRAHQEVLAVRQKVRPAYVINEQVCDRQWDCFTSGSRDSANAASGRDGHEGNDAIPAPRASAWVAGVRQRQRSSTGQINAFEFVVRKKSNRSSIG